MDNKHCIPCTQVSKTMNKQDIQQELNSLNQWQYIVCEGIDQLHKEYSFEKYQQALDFTNKIAQLAITEKHHPEIILAYKTVKVIWWTHKVNGLHQNDFILAQRTDNLC